MLHKYLNFDEGEKTFDISTLTKRGARLIYICVYKSITIEGNYILPVGEHNIQFPILNGRLPNNFTLTGGQCDIAIQELAEKGDKNYWKITKENDNGIPTYRGEYDTELLNRRKNNANK